MSGNGSNSSYICDEVTVTNYFIFDNCNDSYIFLSNGNQFYSFIVTLLAHDWTSHL